MWITWLLYLLQKVRPLLRLVWTSMGSRVAFKMWHRSLRAMIRKKTNKQKRTDNIREKRLKTRNKNTHTKTALQRKLSYRFVIGCFFPHCTFLLVLSAVFIFFAQIVGSVSLLVYGHTPTYSVLTNRWSFNWVSPTLGAFGWVTQPEDSHAAYGGICKQLAICKQSRGSIQQGSWLL